MKENGSCVEQTQDFSTGQREGLNHIDWSIFHRTWGQNDEDMAMQITQQLPEYFHQKTGIQTLPPLGWCSMLASQEYLRRRHFWGNVLFRWCSWTKAAPWMRPVRQPSLCPGPAIRVGCLLRLEMLAESSKCWLEWLQAAMVSCFEYRISCSMNMRGCDDHRGQPIPQDFPWWSWVLWCYLI